MRWEMERKVHSGKLHKFYHSPNIVRAIKSRRLGWVGHVAEVDKGSSLFKIISGKHTGKRPLGRPNCR